MKIYHEGRLSLPLKGRKILIVGSRNASQDGLLRTEKAVNNAPDNSIILSGLALGIDAAAHRAALEKQIPTIAILGTSLDKCYPAVHQELQNQMDLLISQFQPFTQIFPRNFVMRDKLAALLCDECIIIEAENNGGTLHTGREALRLRRPLIISESEKDKDWAKEFTSKGATFRDFGP